MNIRLISMLALILFLSNIYGQSVGFEAGFNVGLSSIQSDYGERGDIKSGLTGNIGTSIGGLFYINFFNGSDNWNERTGFFDTHFKLKNEFSYTSAKLEQFGSNIEGDTEQAEKFKAMHGQMSSVNIGTTLEYHFNDLDVFKNSRHGKFDPFIGIGAMVNFSKPSFESDLGDYKQDITILPTVYQNGAINVDPETVFSVLFSAGTRINAGNNGDLILDSRWQYFSSNNIDALNPSISGNKFNEWAFTLSLGYVFFIN